MKLASKTAIVTGAARGIGFGIAQVLAREGARVIIADRDTHGEAAAASLRIPGLRPSGIQKKCNSVRADYPAPGYFKLNAAA